MNSSTRYGIRGIPAPDFPRSTKLQGILIDRAKGPRPGKGQLWIIRRVAASISLLGKMDRETRRESIMLAVPYRGTVPALTDCGSAGRAEYAMLDTARPRPIPRIRKRPAPRAFAGNRRPQRYPPDAGIRPRWPRRCLALKSMSWLGPRGGAADAPPDHRSAQRRDQGAPPSSCPTSSGGSPGEQEWLAAPSSPEELQRRIETENRAPTTKIAAGERHHG